MPIEIRELHIRVNVNEAETTGRQVENPNERRQNRDDATDAVVKAAVEQLLRILQNQKER
jgi:hypothetical protein